MFSGIVETIGTLSEMEPNQGSLRAHVECGGYDTAQLGIGESIAVSGVCLTVAAVSKNGFWADVSPETRSCTTLGLAKPGLSVNLERSLTPASRMGGHFVTGHVDARAQVARIEHDADCVRLQIAIPERLSSYVANKGSICVDGVSLTVNAIAGRLIDLLLVPHTCRVTTLGDLGEGAAVNIEVDLLARYVERLLSARPRAQREPSPVTEELLQRCGFIAGNAGEADE